ncbi:MAG: hypothetical protein ACD_19C00150G0002 [uncultured bacterium]|nr:MAG: hypothetical protein ACD_19C00150G0002 [uncultured bacterium]
MNNSDLNDWAKTHVFYNLYDHLSSRHRFDVEEYKHKQKQLGTPNGHILLKNNFFDSLKGEKKMYLAHTTSNLKKVIESKALYSSAGCLVGSIYCSQLTKEANNFRMHNLSSYIHNNEVQKFTDEKSTSVDTLIIEVNMDKDSNNNLIGVDYLRLGDIHFSIYKHLEYLLSCNERAELSNILTNHIRNGFGFLSRCRNIFNHHISVDNDKFLAEFTENIKSLPILGYIYFESIVEYILLFQDSPRASQFHDLKEFYNPSYKDLIFSVWPKLSKSYSLNTFQPKFSVVTNYLKTHHVFNKFSENEFKDYVVQKILYLVNTRLFNDLDDIMWKEVRMDMDNLSEHFRPLIGHLIHRELRNFGRYPNFYHYFDEVKALRIWNYWNHMNLSIPFNGIIPKGEIGINPAYTNLKYKVYSSNLTTKDNLSYLVPDKQLDISIVPKLVDLKFTLMRDRENKSSSAK